MNRQALDFYGQMPGEMKNYLRHNGWHFNRRAYDLAASLMKKADRNGGKPEKVEPFKKEEVDSLLEKNGIRLENNIGYDAAYVATAARADMWKSSLEDEKHLALHVKDVVDDVDQADGFIMRRWYSDMIGKGIPIMWEELI